MSKTRFSKHIIAILISLVFVCIDAGAQTPLSDDMIAKINKIATDSLASTGVPSASVAVVKDGQIVFTKTYGDAKLTPKTAASPSMRYSIGSISKQFTAAAMLLLQEQGKLSLNDKVSKYVPELTRANEVTIRQLLSHTSGYQDYWPQDYVMPGMLKPTSAKAIMDTWAKIPLDFDPGTKWQYSNTNFVIAGVIIEKVSGMPLMKFLQEKVFAPLGMKSVADIDAARLGETDPTGYLRYALGPLREAPKEGPGWLFAAGELAMPASELAKWDISIMDQKLLKPASYREFAQDTLLLNGTSTHYGLGVDVNTQGGHRILSHGGEVSGFTAQNNVFPDDRAAVVVLTNQDAASASGSIAGGISQLLFATSGDAATPAKLDQAKKIFAGLQKGTIDRSLFTDNCNFYFGEQSLKDFASSLAPFGTPVSFEQVRQGLRGGMVLRVYIIGFANRSLRAWTYEMPGGKLEQFQIATQN
ncbi:MAG: serine hydrolase domain-containing protein [Pyrinomonadaceae bacterium]